mmetsp:Transcript_14361/g.30846  ORF Transcript_14361/g.30846 Transcript_14361/m.30846 type:complete len:211 (-) Transcript_14361:1501-2133(-)
MPMFSLILRGHDSKNNGRPVWLLLAFTSPNGSSHAPPNTGLVDTADVRLIHWYKYLSEQTIQPRSDTHSFQDFICKDVLCVALSDITLKRRNGVVFIFLDVHLDFANYLSQGLDECCNVSHRLSDVSKDAFFIHIVHLPSRHYKPLQCIRDLTKALLTQDHRRYVLKSILPRLCTLLILRVNMRNTLPRNTRRSIRRHHELLPQAIEKLP